MAGVEFKQLAEGFFYASGLFKDVGSETSTRQAKQAAQRTKRFFMKTIPLPLKAFPPLPLKDAFDESVGCCGELCTRCTLPGAVRNNTWVFVTIQITAG